MAVCPWCEREMTTARSCTVAALHVDGVPRLLSRSWEYESCHDCGVARGGLHHPGCDMQQCPDCGGQLLSCGCRFDEHRGDDEPDDLDEPDGDQAVRWSGLSPLVGRAFGTTFEMPERADWGPLEALAARTAHEARSMRVDAEEFMYMGTARNRRKHLAVHLYKHIETRGYLNLDADGQAYAYCGTDRDRYRRYRSLADAVRRLELWWLEDCADHQWVAAGKDDDGRLLL